MREVTGRMWRRRVTRKMPRRKLSGRIPSGQVYGRRWSRKWVGDCGRERVCRRKWRKNVGECGRRTWVREGEEGGWGNVEEEGGCVREMLQDEPGIIKRGEAGQRSLWSNKDRLRVESRYLCIGSWKT